MRLSAAMRIQLNDPRLLPELVRYLRTRVDAIVSEVGDRELEVSLTGSYATGPMRLELYLRLRAWEAARSGAVVEILD
jgi:hypothetical protein